jgi:uncharacterized protein YfaS (alpha-2-macroglobulin family)
MKKFMVLSFVFLLTFALHADPKQVLTVTKVEPESTETDLSLCAQVDEYFSTSTSTDLKPYTKLFPNHPYTVSLEYRAICLKGLKPDTEYRFFIHEKIPLGDKRLKHTYDLNGKTGNYAPSSSFKESGYILPAYGDIAIPIETTNVDELAVSLYRVNENNLMDMINKYGLLQSLTSYKLGYVADRDGYFLWKKRLKIRGEKNKQTVTAIPVGDFLKERKPGVYILTASMVDQDGNEMEYYGSGTQWFMVSDIGLYTLAGDKGMRIYTQSLSLAKAMDGIKLELRSKNNEVLGETVSKGGEAFFEAALLKGTQGLAPKAIYAYGERGDFTVLDLSKAVHDLSDRGVSGRENSGQYDAFVYSNRGIFRPGERFTFHALVREYRRAKPDLKLSAKLYDAGHTEVYSKMLSTDESGALGDSLILSQNAHRGRWHLKLYAGSDKPIGALSFLVDDFVPPKIKVDVTASPSSVKPDQNSTLEISAHYLNNNPLTNAYVATRTLLKRADKPFAGYETYHFGDIQESFRQEFLDEQHYQTDQEGKLKIPLRLGQSSYSSYPVSAHIIVSVNEPGGRPVDRVVTTFFDDKRAYIGLKPLFANDAVDLKSPPAFDLIYLKALQAAAQTLSYRVIEEEVAWNWQSRDGGWEYYRTYSDGRVVAKGEVVMGGKEPTKLQLQKLDWGSYRVELKDKSGIMTTYRFSSGYEASVSKASPDRLPVATDRQRYRIGDKVMVRIQPKFSGPLMVSIAHHDIVQTKKLEVKAGEDTEVPFEVTKEWGSSAYVLATAFRAGGKKLGANRAIGVAHIAVVNPEDNIEVTLQHVKKVRANSTTKIQVQSQALSDSSRYFTLAAVDEGVLGVTGYKMPDPNGHFYGQQKLGIDIRDIYGELIKAAGAHAKFNVGAGAWEDEASNTDAMITNKRKIVALFSDKITFDDTGKGEVELDIPDYQGALKLMAVAWSKDAVGAANSELIVQDPLSVELYMPRFIAVGDQAASLLTVDFDKSMAQGVYHIKLSSEGGIALKEKHFTFKYHKEPRFSTALMLHAAQYEEGAINVAVSDQNGVVMRKRFELAVRRDNPQLYIHKIGRIDQQHRFDPTKEVDQELYKDIQDITLTLSSKALIGVEGLREELIDYGGRCAEQTTSRAMPWLFTKKTAANDALIEKAIDRLVSYQKLDGGFGLWDSSRASLWVSAYVMDFLTRAKSAGYKVPDRSLEQGLNWLENRLNRWSEKVGEKEANAYALYLLTRSGRTLISQIEQLSQSDHLSALAYGHLGAAFQRVGESEQAEKMFKKARSSRRNYANGYYSNYGGELRDSAALVTLMHESGIGSVDQAFIELAQSTKERQYLSTQEMSQILRAAYLMENDSKDTAAQESFNLARLDELKNIRSADEQRWYSLNFTATPQMQHYKKSENYGFDVDKKIYSLDGQAVDITKVKQNDRLVVVVSGDILQKNIKNPLISDWLPAGFELENPNLTGIDETKSLAWLGEQSATDNIAYRDDRFEAALGAGDVTFKIAYIVRAVTKGEYTLPSVKIEDMYQPRFRAMSGANRSRVTIR